MLSDHFVIKSMRGCKKIPTAGLELSVKWRYEANIIPFCSQKKFFLLPLDIRYSYMCDVFLYYSNILYAEIDFQVQLPPMFILLGSFKM